MKIFITLSITLFASTVISQVTILEENFDSPSLPAGWERVDNDGNTLASQVSEYTEAWIYKEDPINAGNGTFSSTSYFDPIDRADRWLITPSITMGSIGNYISWKGLSGDPSFPDSYKVVISTTDSDIASFTDTLAIVTQETPDWTEYTEGLDEYANQSIHIAFVNTTFDGFKLYLDSIYVREQDPLNLSEEKQVDLSVFPNPTDGDFTIKTNQNISSVVLYSAVGKQVRSIEVNSSKEVKVNLSNLPQSLYYVKVKLVSGEVIRRKVQKK